MRVLVDTHAFLWFLSDDPQLSEAARKCIESGENVVLLSAASAWELAIKVSIGKLTISQELSAFLPGQLEENRIQLLNITLPHVIRVSILPWPHRDPFDRLLAAQCLTEGLPLISADRVFDAYGVSRIW